MSQTIVDARGMRCPWPALRLAKAMAGAASVTLLADDPAAPGEISGLAEARGWTLRPIAGGYLVERPAG